MPRALDFFPLCFSRLTQCAWRPQRNSRGGDHNQAKLIPLLIFIVAGFFFIKPGYSRSAGPDGNYSATRCSFVVRFLRDEIALVPSGEVRHRRERSARDYIALVTITIVYILVQLSRKGHWGGASRRIQRRHWLRRRDFSWPSGRLLLLAAATISPLVSSPQYLEFPKNSFCAGRDGILPRPFAHVHPRFIPRCAIVAYSALAFAFP